MLKLESPVSAVPKIGPKYQKLLEKLGVETVNDLLYHFPFRYNDFSVIKKIKNLEDGDLVTIEGVLSDVQNIFTKTRKKLTKAKIADKTGELDVIWFNQHYIKRMLKKGKIYNFSGKVGEFNNRLHLISPEFEEKTGDQINTGRLVPVYPETKGISSKWIRSKISTVLENADYPEFLPDHLMDKYNFITFQKGLEKFHFPDNKFDVEHAKTRFQFEELFMELIKVEERKRQWDKKLTSPKITESGHKKKVDDLIDSLPFKLTNSQKRAVSAIVEDFKKGHPMNRLLEGDVGTGKTIVAVIAAYLTYLNGLKTLYMAPTEILANQHYETFTEYLEPLGVKILLKTSFSKKKLKPEDFDIAVGTHALLHAKDKLDNIGFVVVDEQQRFGVEQRAKIVELGNEGKSPNVLTMTATPIPRTLALTIYGDLDISPLDMPESKIKKVKTWVVPERKRDDAYNWIKEKNEPVFIVCPLIEESLAETMESVKAAEAEYESLRKGVFSDISIGLLHGKMKSEEKQKVVDKFKAGDIKVLVATPVIEVGIDIPEATIMVIESAERYGLASLHQLRGRVGRKGGEAYCLLFASVSSRDSLKRLKAMEKYNNGLKLAEIDMQMRGEGDIYGTSQHGFIDFKVADLSDIEMLERAKSEAVKIFPNLEVYPALRTRLEQISSRFVAQN